MKNKEIPSIETATKQEIFDYVAWFLRQQGEPSVNESDCMYRQWVGDKLLKCAAGCLIPDDKYNSNMETNSAKSIEVLKGLGIADKDFEGCGAKISLIRSLQVAHDNVGQDYHTSKNFYPNFIGEFVRRNCDVAGIDLTYAKSLIEKTPE